MSLPSIPSSDLDHVKPGIAEHFREITAPLQTGFGGRVGLGKWVRYSLKDILLGTNVVGSLLTATNASGHLSYTVVGDTMIVSLNAVALTLSVAASILYMQLPDGWKYFPRQALFPPDSALSLEAAPMVSVDGGGQAAGLLQIRTLAPPGPSSLRIIRDAAASNFTAGNILLRGQLVFECQQIGDR